MEMLLIGETISLIFGLSIGNTIITAKEGLNFELSKYFQGEDGEHYVPQASNLIAKAHLEETVFKLEAFIKTCTFHQGNKFVARGAHWQPNEVMKGC
jgi:hypothetical protein